MSNINALTTVRASLAGSFPMSTSSWHCPRNGLRFGPFNTIGIMKAPLLVIVLIAAHVFAEPPGPATQATTKPGDINQAATKSEDVELPAIIKRAQANYAAAVAKADEDFKKAVQEAKAVGMARYDPFSFSMMNAGEVGSHAV